MSRRSNAEEPTLITTAPVNNDDEFGQRRKKYAIMMTLRGLAVIAAALTYHVSLLLALGFVVAGAVLPWCAVLIANDRPPKRARVQPGHVQPNRDRALPGSSDRTVDG